MTAGERDAGLARARAVLAARPFSAMPGAEVAVLSAEGVELRLPISGVLLQQHGFVHGGVVAYLADNALAFAGGLRLSGRVVTAEMKINHLRSATGEALLARGRALGAGRAQAIALREVFAVAGGVERLCAAAGAAQDPPAADRRVEGQWCASRMSRNAPSRFPGMPTPRYLREA